MVARKAPDISVDTLTGKQAKAEHARLAAEIAGHDRRYYQQDAPTITDAAYDALRRRYDAIEQRFPEYSNKDKLFYYQARALTRLDRPDEAARYYSRLLEEFPKSKYGDRARKRLKKLNGQAPAAGQNPAQKPAEPQAPS